MWVNINSGNLETRGLSYGNCTMAWSVSPLQYLRINCASTMSRETSMWRAVCKNLYLVCPQMENKGIYISVSGVWTTTFVCARLDSLFDRQLCVCTMWPNIHPVHPSCVPLKVQPHCYRFVPTRDITFPSPVALSKPQDIYMSNVRRWAHTAVNKLCSKHVI